MIAQITGTIKDTNLNSIIIDVNGLGYEVFIPDGGDKFKKNEEISLWTHLVIRDTLIELFGFKEKEELLLFKKLIDISGIGPRSAVGIIGIAPITSLGRAIIKEDISYLTKISGIGRKTAEKIILELRGKLDDFALPMEEYSEQDTDVLDALVALGYQMPKVRETVRMIPDDIVDINDRIREALKIINK